MKGAGDGDAALGNEELTSTCRVSIRGRSGSQGAVGREATKTGRAAVTQSFCRQAPGRETGEILDSRVELGNDSVSTASVY